MATFSFILQFCFTSFFPSSLFLLSLDHLFRPLRNNWSFALKPFEIDRFYNLYLHIGNMGNDCTFPSCGQAITSTNIATS